MALSEICFEQIKGNYWLGQYGDFTVIMMKDTGYVNATKLCKDGGKEFKAWYRNQHAQDLIAAVTEHEALDSTNLRGGEFSPTGNALKKVCDDCRSEEGRLIAGTYIHPRLVFHVAYWISTDFAIKMGIIADKFLIDEYLAKVADAEEAKAQAEQARLAAKRAEGEAAADLNRETNAHDSTKKKLRAWGRMHGFKMLKLNSDDALLPYYVIRCLNRTMRKAIHKITTKYPTANTVYEHSAMPNGVNLYKTLKLSGKMVYSGNYCKPKSYVGEAELIDMIGNMVGTVISPKMPTV